MLLVRAHEARIRAWTPHWRFLTAAPHCCSVRRSTNTAVVHRRSVFPCGYYGFATRENRLTMWCPQRFWWANDITLTLCCCKAFRVLLLLIVQGVFARELIVVSCVYMCTTTKIYYWYLGLLIGLLRTYNCSAAYLDYCCTNYCFDWLDHNKVMCGDEACKQ